jgi:hypothetical protein
MLRGQTIKRGQPVEFTHAGKIQFGICVKDGPLGYNIDIETTTGIVSSWQVLSYGWAGWLPEELIKIWEKYNPVSEEEVYDFN